MSIINDLYKMSKLVSTETSRIFMRFIYYKNMFLESILNLKILQVYTM